MIIQIAPLEKWANWLQAVPMGWYASLGTLLAVYLLWKFLIDKPVSFRKPAKALSFLNLRWVSLLVGSVILVLQAVLQPGHDPFRP